LPPLVVNNLFRFIGGGKPPFLICSNVWETLNRFVLIRFDLSNLWPIIQPLTNCY